MRKILAIDSEVLPNIFLKVLEAKELLILNPDQGISEIVKKVGISRSTFYKYKDYVFSISDTVIGSKALIQLSLLDEKGILSSILNVLSDNGVNILTINQTIPINKVANVVLTIELSKDSNIDIILKKIGEKYGVLKSELIALDKYI